MDYDVIVVGGGAAGLMAACTAAEQGRKVLLIEKMDQAGRKLRITGKGRCNLTNTNSLRDTLPHIGSSTAGTTKKPGQTGGVWLRNAYGRFFAPELMEWFERRGVELTVERGNRVYPASGKALDIFLALIGELEQNPNVTIRKNTTVKSIETFEGQATAAILERGERIPCRHIILATGGLSYPTTGSTGAGYRICRELGHTVVDPVPSLVALKCQEKIPEELVVEYRRGGRTAILPFPEYYEEGVENTPARIIMSEMHGSGLLYRNCFTDRRLRFPEYDSRFPYALGQEHPSFLYRLALARLMYPFELSEDAKKAYETFLKENISQVLNYFTTNRDQTAVGFLMQLNRKKSDIRRNIFEL